MNNSVRAVCLLVFAFVALRPAGAAPDCSNWTLDGYRLGMRGDELLAVRSVTLHVAGQAQVTEPGRLHGVLVMDARELLEKWDVRYDAGYGQGLRTVLRERFGTPSSDVSGELPGDASNGARQRRTIWRSSACDAAIILYQNAGALGASVPSVSATLTRASILPPGLIEMKTLYP